MKRKSPDNSNNFKEIKLSDHQKDNLNNDNSVLKIINNFLDIKILKKYILKKNFDYQENNKKIYIDKISDEKNTLNKEIDENSTFNKEIDENSTLNKEIDCKKSDETSANEISINETGTDKKGNDNKDNKNFHRFYSKLNKDEYINLLPLIEIIRKKEVQKLKKIKSYPSENKNNLGIFYYDNYIIRVDEIYDPFYGEMLCLRNVGNGLIQEKYLLLPIYVEIERGYFFSIQPYLKDSHTLYEWVKKRKLKDLESKISLCLKICESISYLHLNNLVHGDIKPDNIMIIEEYGKVNPYLIDFGSVGMHMERLGTGGTKPYCHPKTENTHLLEMNNYKWSKVKKENDTWSLALIFLTLIITDELYYYYKDYPEGFFLENGYINERCFGMLPEKYREGFRYVLEEKDNICIDIFIDLLKN